MGNSGGQSVWADGECGPSIGRSLRGMLGEQMPDPIKAPACATTTGYCWHFDATGTDKQGKRHTAPNGISTHTNRRIERHQLLRTSDRIPLLLGTSWAQREVKGLMNGISGFPPAQGRGPLILLVLLESWGGLREGAIHPQEQT